jgi:hypothetical protein
MNNRNSFTAISFKIYRFSSLFSLLGFMALVTSCVEPSAPIQSLVSTPVLNPLVVKQVENPPAGDKPAANVSPVDQPVIIIPPAPTPPVTKSPVAPPVVAPKVERDLVYSDLGFDAMGFRRSLPYSNPASALQSCFNSNGYNEGGRNFLGIAKADFERDGYDAIVINNVIVENGDALIQRFNRDCFPLYDIIMMDEMTTMDEVVEAVHADPDFATLNQDQISGFLKKTIVLFNFLKAGGLDLNVDLNSLVVRTDYSLSDKLISIDFVQRYNDWQKHKPLDFYNVIDAALTDDILSIAEWQDAKDNGKDKRQAIRKVLAGYRDQDPNVVIPGVATAKGRYQLYKIAEGIASSENKSQIASFLMHGGVHCPDAKLKGIQFSYALANEGDAKQLEADQTKAQGDGIESQIRSMLFEEKSRYYFNWINTLVRGITAVPHPVDEASTVTATWDAYALNLGLEKLGNANGQFVIWGEDPAVVDVRPDHVPGRVPLAPGVYPTPSAAGYDAIARAFIANKNQNVSMWAFSMGDNHRVDNLPGGNFTPQTLHSALNSSEVMKELQRRVLGPVTSLHSFTGAQGFPWVKGLLLRFGALSAP